jgi:hypothetical protein
MSTAIRVMISSRVATEVDGRPLGDARKAIKEELEKVPPGRRSAVFSVWSSEYETPGGQDETAWKRCTREAASCDILLVLYTGEAGSRRNETGIGTVGICHLEFLAGVRDNQPKVRVINVEGLTHVDRDAVDEAFAQDVEQYSSFYRSIRKSDELVPTSCEAVWDAAIDLVRRRGTGRGYNYLGEALDWAQRSYVGRSRAMTQALAEILADPESARWHESVSAVGVWRTIAGRRVAFRCSAAPASLTDAEARATLARLFDNQTEALAHLQSADLVGPVEVVAVHKSATELQVRRLIGRADALVIPVPGGIVASDDSTFVQAIVLPNCRDTNTIRKRLDDIFDWLRRSRMDAVLVARAEARSTVLHALSKIQKAQIEASTGTSVAGTRST